MIKGWCLNKLKYSRSLSLLKSVKTCHKGMSIVALGIGSAGCCILSHLHRSTIPIEKFVYISSDEQDFSYSPLGDKILVDLDSKSLKSPSSIRGVLIDYFDQIKDVLAGSKYVFIIAGLGGNIGSGIAPFLAKVAQEMEAVVVSIVAMPFKFEKHKHFYAGVALRQMRKLSDAVIIIDNDSFLERAPKESILDVFTIINEKVSIAFNKLIGLPEGKETGIGLNKFIESIKEKGYAVLSVHESFTFGDIVAGAARSIGQIAEPDQATKAIIYLVSDRKISTEEVATSVDRLGSFFGKGSIEVLYGISEIGGQGSMAILLASGLRDTKFDDYDPITNILYDLETDDNLDASINIKFPTIYNLNGDN